MCEFCENIKEIREDDIYEKNPLVAETDKFPYREKLVLAKIGSKIIFYGFNKYHYEDDAMYKDIDCKFCPMCGRKLTEE